VIKAKIIDSYANQRISFTSVAYQTVPLAVASLGSGAARGRLRLRRIYFIIISSRSLTFSENRSYNWSIMAN
jgi:hypothetical protein